MAAAKAGVSATQLTAATSGLAATGSSSLAAGFVGPVNPSLLAAGSTSAAASSAGLAAGSTAAYGGATTLGTSEAMSALAGTPEEPFRPGSPRFSRQGIGQRYDRPSMETLNFGFGSSTVNPYVS